VKAFLASQFTLRSLNPWLAQESPLWVKLGNPQNEDMLSALPQNRTLYDGEWNFRVGLGADLTERALLEFRKGPTCHVGPNYRPS
jgi:hypothetical protein